MLARAPQILPTHNIELGHLINVQINGMVHEKKRNKNIIIIINDVVVSYSLLVAMEPYRFFCFAFV